LEDFHQHGQEFPLTANEPLQKTNLAKRICSREQPGVYQEAQQILLEDLHNLLMALKIRKKRASKEKIIYSLKFCHDIQNTISRGTRR
jgi:hypothetical protein